MITINLLPENLKESAGPSSVGVIILILMGISVNLVAVGCFIYLHFLLKPKYQTIENHLVVRLKALEVKTKDYVKIKAEKESLEKKTELVKKMIDERVLWSNRLQDLAIFTHDRRVWFSKLNVTFEQPKKGTEVRRKPGAKATTTGKEKEVPTGPFYVIKLEAFSASKDINIPNDYRKDIVLTEWWKEHFQETNGINDPQYTVASLPSEFYTEEYYHKFPLELRMKSTQKIDPKKVPPKGKK
jgi:phosphoribosylformylglycinamidine (FGAM) synthase PurS component